MFSFQGTFTMNQVLFVFLIPILSLFGEMTCSNMNTSNQLSDEINEQQIMIKFLKNLELIYSASMKKKLQSGGSSTEGINQQCKSHVVKVISEKRNKTYTISSKWIHFIFITKRKVFLDCISIACWKYLQGELNWFVINPDWQEMFSALNWNFSIVVK